MVGVTPLNYLIEGIQILISMAIRPLRKKPNNNNNNNKRSSNPNPNSRSSHSPMVVSANYKSIPLVLSVFLVSCVVITLGFSSSFWTKKLRNVPVSPLIYSIEVVNEFHHDPRAFTQGLVYGGDDTLFESTGIYKHSSVRRVALRTGKVEVIQRMDDSVFGEGLTLINERLFQVAWLTQTGFIYNRYNLSKVKEFTHQMKDGWGLATDGKVLFGSDGTSTMYKIDPKTMRDIETHVVKFNGKEVPYLNELEYVENEVWANVYGKDCIARISPTDGSVIGWILLPELREKLIANGNLGIDVLNGIAWDGENHRIFVTGKLWPKLFEIKVRRSNKQFEAQDLEKMCVWPRHYYSFT